MYPMTGSSDADVDGGCHDNVTDVDSTLSAVSWRGDEGPRPSPDSLSNAVGGPTAVHLHIRVMTSLGDVIKPNNDVIIA